MSPTIEGTGILPLADASDQSLVGGKAAGLHRLIRLGVWVPPGVVISAPMVARFNAGTIPKELWQQILIARRSLSAPRLIARSSAIGEDSRECSFAGQLDSIGDVNDDAQLWHALLKCAGSQQSERVVSYGQSRGRRLAGLAIVIQEQIDAIASGVLFTASPDGSECALIEYCPGAGEALVAGRINPGRISVMPDGQPRQLASCDAIVLQDDAVRAIVDEGRRIADAFKEPQDIEWAIDRAGRCWFVQSRPITVRAEKRDSEPTVLWSNANVNENFPDPISPLLYSIASLGYYHYFKNLGRAFGIARHRLDSIEDSLRHIIGVQAGRMYYNLTSIHTALRAAPFGEQLAASFNQFVGTSALAPAVSGGKRRLRMPQWLETLRIAAAVTWQYAFLTRRVARFERTVNAYAASTHPMRLPRLRRPELLGRLRGFMEIRCHQWKNASLADAGSMVCYAALKSLLQRSLPSEDQEALHNTLLKALPDLVSGKPALELWKLSRTLLGNDRLARLFASEEPDVVMAAVYREPAFAEFRHQLDDYLEHWGFRCSSELMLTVPGFQENPAALVPILRAYAETNTDSPSTRLAHQREERLRETRRVVRLLPWFFATPLRVLLSWTQKSIQLRERARLKQALLYSRLRRVALAIGDELVAANTLDSRDDVFMLTVQEIDDLLAGAAMFPREIRGLATLRREAHDRFRAVRPQDTLMLPQGTYLEPGTSETTQMNSRSLTGTSACGGRSTGRATVIADISEAHRLAAGDILVTRQTDPGWGPVFPLISGLVMERGGMLSHGAIIAREFGIPSVVGVVDATRLIPHGAVVCLDGDRGTVRLLSEVA